MIESNPQTPVSAAVERQPSSAPSGAPTPQAAGGWFTCNVNQVGPAEDNNVYVMLSDTGGSFNHTWYQVFEPMKSQMLAVALTAVSTGYPVAAALASTDPYSTCERLYIVSS